MMVSDLEVNDFRGIRECNSDALEGGPVIVTAGLGAVDVLAHHRDALALGVRVGIQELPSMLWYRGLWDGKRA